MPEYQELLTEDAEQLAVELIEGFKKRLVSAADEAISELYVNISAYIESDAWQNLRQLMLDELKGYPKASVRFEHDFRQIRQQMFRENKEEIIGDLNADLLRENNDLKEETARRRNKQ